MLLVALTHINIFGTVNFLFTVWCYSLALNVLVTLLICGRLAYYRFLLKKTLGGNAAAPYTSIAAMIVESEAIYTAYLIVFIVPLIRNNPLAYALIESPAAVQVRSVPLSSVDYLLIKHGYSL